MKNLFVAMLMLCGFTTASAQGWPEHYEGVMLQGFYWDSFNESQWTYLEKKSDEISEYFSLVWLPQSGNCGGLSMGYNPLYYYDQNSSFGTEQELRSLITTFKAKGVGTIADVVVNHRATLTNWVDFPKETYNGVTYQMLSTDIVADDDNGKTKTWAEANGYKLSYNKDTGEGWDGMRDLDHVSSNVQNCIIAYENYLLNDLGYAGFRYDVAKGFASKYFALYNSRTKPGFSVGEVWDSNDFIKNWINGTKYYGATTYDEPQSAAFDFQFRYLVRDAIKGGNWTKVTGTNSLISDDNYKRYAVTFVENHDTERRKDSQQDPILKDTIAANACILAMPGTPCVFYTHWLNCKKAIKQMIAARKLVGIHNQSKTTRIVIDPSQTVISVEGNNGTMLVALGQNATNYRCTGYKTLLSGRKFQYLVEDGFDTSTWQATLDYIDATTKDDDPKKVDVPPFCTLEEGKVIAFFEAPDSWTKTIMCWCWDNAGAKKCYTGTNWPGVECKHLGTAANGNEVWRWTYDSTQFDAVKPMIIFNNNGQPQTADMEFVNGGYYTQTGLAATVTAGIETVVSDNNANAMYNLQGVRVDSSYRGIVISGGQKMINR